MPAASREDLTKAIEQVQALSALPEGKRAYQEDEVWEKLHAASKIARGDVAALDGFPPNAMRACLEFVATYGMKRKVLKKRADECVKMFLSNQQWLDLVNSEPEIRNVLEGSSAGYPQYSSMGSLTSSFSASSSSRATKKPVPTGDVEKLDKDLGDVKVRLVQAVNGMQKFDWLFPAESSTSAKRDEATEVFSEFYSAVQHLVVISERPEACTCPEIVDEKVLDTLSDHWKDVTQFLLTTYLARGPLRTRVKSVVDKISKFSVSFNSEANSGFWPHIGVGDGQQAHQIEQDRSLAQELEGSFVEEAQEAKAQEERDRSLAQELSSPCFSDVQEFVTTKIVENSADVLVVPEGFVVVNAFYGDAKRQQGADVTKEVQELYERRKSIRASNGLFGDPLPGVGKTLFVDLAEARQGDPAVDLCAAFSSIRGPLELKPGTRLEWMWANPRTLPLPGMNALAKIDPLGIRWSRKMTAAECVEDLLAHEKKIQAVLVRLVDTEESHKFKSPKDAADTIANSAS